jgi:hypothetical protein
MKTLLCTLLGFVFSCVLAAQDINEGVLQIQTNKKVYNFGDSIHFAISDVSGTIPDGTLIHVSLLNELGDLLENGVYVLDNEHACGSFVNRFVKRGPVALRAYFTSNGKPTHIARSVFRIAAHGEGYNTDVPEDLKPVFINRAFFVSDTKLAKYYFVKEPFPSANIQYQIIDKNGQIQEISKAIRINDTTIMVPEIDLQDRGSIRFFFNNKVQYQQYDVIKMRSYSPNEGSKWSNDSILKNLMPFFVAQEKKMSNQPDNNMVSIFADGELPNVTVRTTTKNRLQEMEEKYTQSAFFKGQFGISFDMLTDPSAANSLTVEEFINRKVPGLRVSYVPGTLSPILTYRMGGVEIWVDESPSNFVPPIWDIAYVKFIKSSIRGINTGFGGFFSGGGAGVQGTLAIYTKKGNEANDYNSLFVKSVILPLVGIDPAHTCKETSLK